MNAIFYVIHCFLILESRLDWQYSGFVRLINVLRIGKGGTSVYGLNLYRNPIGIVGCQAIRDLLKHSRYAALTDLNLASCSIDTDGLAAIMKFMPKNETLVKLHLQGNKFAYDGSIIAKGVVPNRHLQYLDLSRNDFTSAGVCTFAETINTLKHHNRKLQTLILSECDICDVGAKSIGDMLRVCNCHLSFVIYLIISTPNSIELFFRLIICGFYSLIFKGIELLQLDANISQRESDATSTCYF